VQSSKFPCKGILPHYQLLQIITTVTKFNADTENCIANTIDYAQKNPDVKLFKVAVKFVVPYSLFYYRRMDVLLATPVVATIKL